MFRRLSKTFKRDKDSNKAGTNGYTNGHTNGTPKKGVDVTSARPSGSSSEPDSSKETSATHEDVQDTFEQYAQLIHAAQRPLPNQSGNGAYLEKEEPTGFWADIKSLGLKDLRTVRHIMEDKAAGKPQDDRQMHMEEIIQVSISPEPSSGD
jgi:linoleate 10R-lipoxygenase